MNLDGLRKRGLLFWLLALFLWLPTASFALVSLSMIGYTFFPTDTQIYASVMANNKAQHVTIISHGMQDAPNSWSSDLQRILAVQNPSVQVIALDWSDDARSVFRCSVQGRRIGAYLGERLSSNANLKSVHVIAHSCGSFVNLGICEALQASRPEVLVQATYLDPVSVYGGLFWSYGVEHFGRCATFSDAYIDTEDDVPGSNQLLPATHTFDVTAIKKCSGFDGNPHVWPTAYYVRISQGLLNLDQRVHTALLKEFPKGRLSTLSQSPLCEG